VTAGNSDLVSFWDYELFKLLGEIQLEGDVTSLEFLHHYSILLVGSNSDRVFLFSFIIRNQAEAFFTLIAVIDTFLISNPDFKPEPLY
jgi:hypothetical protein